MNKHEKLIFQIIWGKSDANISFSDLVNLLLHLGFELRISGSNHIFRKAEIDEKPNLQKDGSKAKQYHVGQIRNLILKYRLGEQNDH